MIFAAFFFLLISFGSSLLFFCFLVGYAQQSETRSRDVRLGADGVFFFCFFLRHKRRKKERERERERERRRVVCWIGLHYSAVHDKPRGTDTAWLSYGWHYAGSRRERPLPFWPDIIIITELSLPLSSSTSFPSSSSSSSSSSFSSLWAVRWWTQETPLSDSRTTHPSNRKKNIINKKKIKSFSTISIRLRVAR